MTDNVVTAALVDLLHANVARPSCQARLIERCRCLKCATERARAALASAAPAPTGQPAERFDLSQTAGFYQAMNERPLIDAEQAWLYRNALQKIGAFDDDTSAASKAAIARAALASPVAPEAAPVEAKELFELRWRWHSDTDGDWDVVSGPRCPRGTPDGYKETAITLTDDDFDIAHTPAAAPRAPGAEQEDQHPSAEEWWTGKSPAEPAGAVPLTDAEIADLWNNTPNLDNEEFAVAFGRAVLAAQARQGEPVAFKRSQFRNGWTTFNVRDEHADEAERRLLGEAARKALSPAPKDSK